MTAKAAGLSPENSLKFQQGLMEQDMERTENLALQMLMELKRDFPMEFVSLDGKDPPIPKVIKTIFPDKA